MKIVIQCAGRKNQTAPNTGFRAAGERLVKFVSRPDIAPPCTDYLYVRPDDLVDGIQSWRDRLVEYNKRPENALGLLPAYQLYRPAAYANLVEAFGKEKVFILSAGWGLISADFLIPDYDITFNKNVQPHAYRDKYDKYADFCMLPDDSEDIVFLGGSAYRPLFFQLTSPLKAKKIVFTKSSNHVGPVPGYAFQRFETKQNTNWHYSCAQALIDGKID